MGLSLRKVVIVGNSVAQRTRPHVPGRSRSYGELLERELNATTPEQWIVSNHSFSRATELVVGSVNEKLRRLVAAKLIVHPIS